MKRLLAKRPIAGRIALAVSIGLLTAAGAQSSTAVSPSLAVVPVPNESVAVIDPALANAKGEVEVVVQLDGQPLAIANGPNSKRAGGLMTKQQQSAYSNALTARQSSVLSQIAALGGVETGRVRIAYNAVIVKIDASQLNSLSQLAGVISVRPVVHFELDLSETVPYVGAAAVQAQGVDGSGVVVAVLDSGIDYTHFNLGGSGNVADYLAAYGANTNDPKTTTLDGLFPTDKVIGGYDFVGETWTPNSGTRTEDPDPIDCGPSTIAAPCAGGHGTHVADIIAGKSNDGSHKGVAPGAKLLAVKICSAVSSSCNGTAILKGIDFSLDPNGDGSMDDAVDVINMSLGASYGQQENSSVEASANAVRAGVVVVASAGNSADRPYITGSPSMTPEVISVAQTSVPSDKLYAIKSSRPDVAGVWLNWSSAPVNQTAPLAYDTTSGATRIGCTNAAGTNPWAGTPLAGKIVLMDRGTCSISLKVSNARAAGAIAAIVANNASQGPGELPPNFSFGGGNPSIPGYSIRQDDGASLKLINGQNVTIDAANPVLIPGSMASTSSRGPSYSTNKIKPDVGAPGASVSADAGSGRNQSTFGGTSGAAPMVAGAAALLLDKYPDRSPAEIKALLMNTAETEVYINSFYKPQRAFLAPITRIGGGELRVDRAVESETAAWDAQDLTGSLSFGYQTVTGVHTFIRTVRVQNYSSETRTYSVSPSFRYLNDETSGAVSVDVPSSITVPGKGARTFNVKLTVDAGKVPFWTLNGGARGGDGFRLQDVEFDGYINISGGGDDVHLAWQIMTHRAADVRAVGEAIVTSSKGASVITLDNRSPVLNGLVDVFSLTGTSPRITKPNLPGVGDMRAVIDIASVGVRAVNIGTSGSWVGNVGIQFAINTYGKRAHPNYPAGWQVVIDANQDGTADWVVFNAENGGFAATGQNLTAVRPANSTTGSAFFFTDADLNSGNVILTVPASRVGVTSLTQQFTFSVYATDNYFTGATTDAIEGMRYSLGLPKYVPSNPAPTVEAGKKLPIGIAPVAGGDTASPSQKGLLFMYRDATGSEADAILAQ